MESQVTLYECTFQSLKRFCRVSGPEVEWNYPQHLDDKYTLQGSRDACSRLRDYLRWNESSFNSALRENPALEKTLDDFLWLQRALLHPQSPYLSEEATDMRRPSKCTPSMSLLNLTAEIEECAWFFLQLFDQTEMAVCPNIPGSRTALANYALY